MPNVLAFAEQRDGKLRRASLEVLTAARTVADALGGEVHALLIAPGGTAAMAAELGRYGADKVLAGESAALAQYVPEAYARAVADAAKGGYHTVILPASPVGKDLAPRVAVRLDAALASDATAIGVEGGELVVTRPIYGGRIFATVTVEGACRIVSLRPNVVRALESAKAGALQPLALPAETGRVKVRELKAAGSAKLDVGEAPIVVSGGRGMKAPENWNLLEDLAAALGGTCALGASRAVVDAGWRPHAEQVGQTGKTVSPQLYVAVGISGAMQHLAGMRSARTIVAINKDADAPIFKVADYGLVGDLFEVVPALAQEIRKLNAR
jgi:electron transfer flavoprotein alpha subunit